MDLEFLLGLILYFGASPITKMAFQNMAAAMKEEKPKVSRRLAADSAPAAFNSA